MKLDKIKSDRILEAAAIIGKLQLILCIILLGGCAMLDLLPAELPEKSPEPNLEFSLNSDLEEIVQQNNKQFAARMQTHSLPVPRLVVTSEVRKELNNLLLDNARTVRDGLERQVQLFPVLENVLKDEGMPDEVLNLALIESNFRPDANSSAGAVGLWQFMPGTARHYGLEVTGRSDERKDPILSTVAASRYLKNLYVKFNDWYLALAAYNAGDGAIAKAISVNGGTKDFWELSRKGKLPGETSRFVPKFIAASILQKLRMRYGAEVQLAQYVDRHIISVSNSSHGATFALNVDSIDKLG